MNRDNGDSTNRINPAEKPVPIIRASELAQYGFCQRAWWLTNIKQIQSRSRSTLRRGQQFHAQHTRQVRTAARWQQSGMWLLMAGTFFLIIAVVSLWLGGG